MPATEAREWMDDSFGTQAYTCRLMFIARLLSLLTLVIINFKSVYSILQSVRRL